MSKKEKIEEAMPEEMGPETLSAIDELRRITEDDDTPVGALTLRKILGGVILSTKMMRRQVWLSLLIALFVTIYVAFRYQCQEDMIKISQLENQLTDAKYKALSSSSNLTEKCRESRVMDMLRLHNDSTLHASNQPPYKIYVPEK